jgi:ring-1,2-phenylacetyl-CoA epoxidase subunit PaaE
MSHFHSLSIDRVQQDTRDAIIVSLHLPDELRSVFAYQQGQHLTLRAMIDGEDVRRSYSLCSAVQDEQLQIAIKKVSGGIFRCPCSQRSRVTIWPLQPAVVSRRSTRLSRPVY